jgi:tetratricopeptide (TPR) repeat protein
MPPPPPTTTAQQLLGKKHADTLQSANHYGSLLYSLRDYEAAERLLSDTLARSRKARGDSDPITLTTINNLGNVLHSKGDLDGALPLLKEAVTNSRATLGAAHVESCISIANLALLLKDMAFRGGSDGKGTNGEDPDAPSDELSDAVAVGDFNGDGKVDEAERRRALVEEGQALLVEAARGFRQKRAELGEAHPHVRSIGMPTRYARVGGRPRSECLHGVSGRSGGRWRGRQ